MTVLTTSPYAWENWVGYFKDFPTFFQGFLFTLAISVGAFIMAMFLGIVFGSLSSSKNKVLKIIARVYVEYYQNTPLLVQFMIVYYGLPLISNYVLMRPSTGQLLSAWDSITVPILQRSFVQGLKLCQLVKQKLHFHKDLLKLKPCGLSFCHRPFRPFCHL